MGKRQDAFHPELDTEHSWMIILNQGVWNYFFKVSKNDNRCEYVNLGEGKHQLIIHKVFIKVTNKLQIGNNKRL